MNKWTLCDTLLATAGFLSLIAYLGIQFVTGQDPSRLISCILFLIASISFQGLFLRIMTCKTLKLLPLILSVLLATWGAWLYCTSVSWANAALEDLLIWYVSPLAGCLTAFLWKRT